MGAQFRSEFGAWNIFRSKMIGSRGEALSLNNVTASSITPQWLIKCQDFFSSEINKYDKDSAPCLDVFLGATRALTYDASGEVRGDGQIISKPIIITMKRGSWGPGIQDYMINGKNIREIQLTRFSSIEGTNTPIQILLYNTCKINAYEQTADVIEFSFIYQKVIDKEIVYDSEGKNIGTTAMEFDTSAVVVKVPNN